MRPSQLASRLPRRTMHRPSVAELVKRYQEYLPPQGVEELAKTALPPNSLVSESEQETMPVPYLRTRIRARSKTRNQGLSKRSSISDFEQSYAANIAPKYLTHTRRPLGQTKNSRIPVPVVPVPESHQPSRRTSPDKRPSMSRMHSEGTARGESSRLQSTGPFVVPKGRTKPVLIRTTIKDEKNRPPRAGPARRTIGTGSKVTNIAKHFERLGRDNERASRRYAVIRGRRARPVATARAKVEILESITDVINDDEESDGSDSSEADDEGGEEEDSRPSETSPDGNSVSSIPSAATGVIPDPLFETSEDTNMESSPAVQPSKDDTLPPSTPFEPQPGTSIPISPALPHLPSTPAASPPAELDIGSTGPERVSILKTLAGFWPQQSQPSRSIDVDDPMSDPEHIFRDSSMVVRTDEPTSIIALALK